MSIRSRRLSIMQYLKNPVTQEKLIDIKDVEDICENWKARRTYAYVVHDKDVFTEKEIEQVSDNLIRIQEKYNNKEISKEELQERYRYEKSKKAGELKPAHIHLYVELTYNIELEVVAKKFNVPVQYVKVVDGRTSSVLDMLEYFTHEKEKEQEAGKYRYADEEIKVVSVEEKLNNGKWRGEIERKKEENLKYGRNLTSKDRMLSDIYRGVSLRECIERDEITYLNNMSQMKKVRLEYLQKVKEVPPLRLNYYISGKGGIGKNLVSKAVARALYPEIENDEDIFFEVGAKNVAFEGYDGQPVIIWNDCRAIDLIFGFHGRGHLLDILDTHPTKSRENVKYSSVVLTNQVNILNGIEAYKDFLDAIAGEYKNKDGTVCKAEDKSQVYRRMPLIVNLREEDFDLLINKGFAEGTRAYEEYNAYRNIRGNFQKIAERCNGKPELRKELEDKTVGIVVEKHRELENKDCNEESEDDIRKEFEGYGKIKEDEEDDGFMKIEDYEFYELPFD